MALLLSFGILRRFAIGQFSQEAGALAEIRTILLMDNQPDIHLLSRAGVGKRPGLQVRRVELNGRQERSALSDFEYSVGGALHSRGVAIPTDLQLSLAID